MPNDRQHRSPNCRRRQMKLFQRGPAACRADGPGSDQVATAQTNIERRGSCLDETGEVGTMFGVGVWRRRPEVWLPGRELAARELGERDDFIDIAAHCWPDFHRRRHLLIMARDARTDRARPYAFSVTSSADLYLDLLQRCLTREAFLDQEVWNADLSKWPGGSSEVLPTLREHGWRLVEQRVDAGRRAIGNDWPPTAETMIGTARLDNLRTCVETVLADEIPGDLIETGVWRGGSTILMRAILAAHDVADRTVWVADSFEGLPKPDGETYPADEGVDFSGFKQLAVSLEEVKANFARYDLLDDQVRFLKGWFKDTLATAPIDQLAVLRLDGDLYESTMDAIKVLYPKLSVGGFLIIDDYGAFPACQAAIHDYREEHAISEDIVEIDWTGAFWRKQG